ncbi:MAG: hypothetical protein JRI72_02640 [Deltaproteobacteria bacterium]|nr:hypothetical protein [Deltaproteobacteria bacterium]
MTKLNEQTPAEIRRAGWDALREKLGLAGTLKFILEYDRGEGNYTELRRKLFKDKTVRDIIQDMKKDRII